MALFKFVKNIINNKPIDVYNNGDMRRDFTYIDDIVVGILQVLKNQANDTPYNIYNIGNGSPVNLLDFIKAIENTLDKKALLNMVPMQAGDVAETFADISLLRDQFHYQPKTKVSEGIKQFVTWYKNYYA